MPVQPKQQVQQNTRFDRNTKLFELPLKQMEQQRNLMQFFENKDVFDVEYLDQHRFQKPLR
jgi:hypothetical protein